MRAFRSLDAADRYAKDLPILHIHSGTQDLFIVFDGNLETIEQAEVELLAPCSERKRHVATGHLMLRHLDRLGNANWAKSDRPILLNAFPRQRAKYGE